MCARYSVAKDLADFAKFFNFIYRVAFFASRFNITPRQLAPVIVLDNTIYDQIWLLRSLMACRVPRWRGW
jgi:putative SOS response-associated peptidase YedK